MRIRSDSEERTIELGRRLGAAASPGDVIILTGDLGAGKTRITKGIAQGLDISDEITSPTFNIVYEYHDGRLPLYHFDLYRLEDATQLNDIGYWELLGSDGVSVVEWGDRFDEAQPPTRFEMVLALEPDGSRAIFAEAYGEGAKHLLDALAD